MARGKHRAPAPRRAAHRLLRRISTAASQADREFFPLNALAASPVAAGLFSAVAVLLGQHLWWLMAG
ncbi:hypothetical protein [Cryptosporangium phraense]|uniref:Uncharacterized protein n=1 Tax=Cryptosporangium phraense TaxID=2593070 RepID=A0A545ANJ2_9ACTN|nr:hypothetical protein [Cryptosporangium phraense]TQS42831.1 hypothetical protein FL583_22535 [Cryptosporangium phraense]